MNNTPVQRTSTSLDKFSFSHGEPPDNHRVDFNDPNNEEIDRWYSGRKGRQLFRQAVSHKSRKQNDVDRYFKATMFFK